VLHPPACVELHRIWYQALWYTYHSVTLISPFYHHVSSQEIGILKSISYDRNIVQFYGATMVGTEPMLLLEYCEGGDLRCNTWRLRAIGAVVRAAI
jgi:hypothetical protein